MGSRVSKRESPSAIVDGRVRGRQGLVGRPSGGRHDRAGAIGEHEIGQRLVRPDLGEDRLQGRIVALRERRGERGVQQRPGAPHPGVGLVEQGCAIDADGIAHEQREHHDFDHDARQDQAKAQRAAEGFHALRG